MKLAAADLPSWFCLHKAGAPSQDCGPFPEAPGGGESSEAEKGDRSHRQAPCVCLFQVRCVSVLHTVVILRLARVTQQSVVRALCVPVCAWPRLCLSIHLWMDLAASAVGCYESCSVNIGIPASVHIPTVSSFGRVLRVQLLGHVVGLCPAF